MKSLRATALLVGSTFATTLAGGLAHAQSTITISVEEPPAAPRLQSPFVFSAAPSSPFLFAVPATGQAPLEFSATGLPDGLALASQTGIISGTTPAAGSYAVEVTVENATGSASATYTLVSGGALAVTPPMGWNSYDSFGASVTEQDMIEQAEAVRMYLQPFGWNYVVIDYRWYEPGQPIDDNGRYLPPTSKYPSATGDSGFTSLSNRIHEMGLGFGIHIMRGIPRKSYDANLPIAGSNSTTGDAGNTSDPCPWDDHMWGASGDPAAVQAWYDALLSQYASWGVDFIKIDDMLNNTTRSFHAAEAAAIRAAADKTGRSIVLSFSPGPDDPSWLPGSVGDLNDSADMWRVVNDFWDYNALTDLPGVFAAANTWQNVDGLVPGHWPDLDMLPLGYLGPRNEWHTSGQTTFTENEQVSIMTLWSMLPSPLMFGGNPSRLDSDDWTLALLTNEEVLAVNQDSLGAHGRRMAANSGEIWTRELSGGRTAVAFFNRGGQDAMMSVSFTDVGVTETPVVRDLWRREDVTAAGDSLTASVPGGGAVVFTLSPPGSVGAGGAGGMGGMGGTAANGGAAGTPSTGGASGEVGAGGTATGGSSGSSGDAGGGPIESGGGGSAGMGLAGTGPAGTGPGGAGPDAAGSAGASPGGASAGGAMSAPTAGGDVPTGPEPNVSSGGTGSAATTSGEAGGCGCALAGSRRQPAAFLLLSAGVALNLLRRRQRRRSR